MANFVLSLMEQRCRRPKALVGCSHEHAPIRGRAKVDGVSVSVAEVSGIYTPVQATLYARCVRRGIEDWTRQGNKRREAVTDLKVLAQQAQGSGPQSRESNCEKQSEGGQAEIKEPIGMYGGRLEANFHVVVGQVSSIRNIGRCIKSAGLKMKNITLEPLASSQAVLSLEEKEAGVALIDIGGGTTDLAIFKDGIIRHTAVIPFGGNVITDDIKEG